MTPPCRRRATPRCQTPAPHRPPTAAPPESPPCPSSSPTIRRSSHRSRTTAAIVATGASLATTTIATTRAGPSATTIAAIASRGTAATTAIATMAIATSSNNANGRRGRRGRQRNGPRPEQNSNAPVSVLVADGTTTGWFDSARDGGFIRRAEESYLPIAAGCIRSVADRAAARTPPRRSGRGDHGPRSARPSRRGRGHVGERRRPDERVAPSRFQLAHRVVSRAQADARDGAVAQDQPRAHAARDRSHRADRLRTARAHRRPGTRRQDDAAAGDHRGDRDQSPRGDAARAPRRRASRRSERDDRVGTRRSRRVELRHARGAPRRCGGHDARARTPARGAGEGRRHRARLDHAPRARPQHGGARNRDAR